MSAVLDAVLPSPPSFGLPSLWPDWRPGQAETVLAMLDCPTRFRALCASTGSGKSCMYTALAILSGAQHTVILTSTVALQNQLAHDLSELPGVHLMQGQSRYVCKALVPGGALYDDYGDGQAVPLVHEGPCHAGVECRLKAGGCGYFDAVRATTTAQILVTNYAWWFSLVKSQQVALAPDLLVCDEAHAAPDALASALGAVLTPDDMAVGNLRGPLVADARDAQGWVEWATAEAVRLSPQVEHAKPSSRRELGHLRKLRHVLRQLDALARMPVDKVVMTPDRDSVRFDVTWAADFGEGWLFRGVPQVVLSSATLTSHTADLLGIAPEDLTLHEAGDGFAPARRPVYVVPTVRVDHRWSDADERFWLSRIDQILAARPGRKGIIHTVSYKRRDLILEKSAHKGRMVTHGRTNAAAEIERFKRAPAGTVLVSPSVTTGYDFPGDTCRFQIITKLPFPDARDPIIAARTARDKTYPSYLAMQEIVQMVGRGVRAADDWCEALVIDDHASWLFGKRKLAPRWFWRAVRTTSTVPAPLTL